MSRNMPTLAAKRSIQQPRGMTSTTIDPTMATPSNDNECSERAETMNLATDCASNVGRMPGRAQPRNLRLRNPSDEWAKRAAEVLPQGLHRPQNGAAPTRAQSPHAPQSSPHMKSTHVVVTLVFLNKLMVLSALSRLRALGALLDALASCLWGQGAVTFEPAAVNTSATYLLWAIFCSSDNNHANVTKTFNSDK